MASLCPAISAAKEGQAPTVSTKVTTGKPNRSARSKNRKAVLKGGMWRPFKTQIFLKNMRAF